MSNAPVYLQAKEGETLTPEAVDHKTSLAFADVTTSINTLSGRIDKVESWQRDSNTKLGSILTILKTDKAVEIERRGNSVKQIGDLEDCMYDSNGNPGIRTRVDRSEQSMKQVKFIGAAIVLSLIGVIVKVLSGT